MFLEVFAAARRQGVLTALVFYFASICSLHCQNKFYSLYKDTAILQGDYSVKVEDTYARMFFLKSTIWIFNPGPNYLVLDYNTAYAIGDDGQKKACRNRDFPVFMPGNSYKQHLKFDATSRGKYVSVHFPDVFVTDKIEARYSPFEIPVSEGVIREVNNIQVEVLKIRRTETEWRIRIRIRHDADEFLAINFKNISVLGDKSGEIFNHVRPYHRMHHRKEGYLEMATLTFPVLPGEKLKSALHFEDVFFVYSLKQLAGFDLNYTVRINEDGNAPSEKEMLEREKKTEED